MLGKKKISRREFINYLFLTSLCIYFIDFLTKEETYKLNSELKRKIDIYNSNRKSQLINNLSLAIESDLKNNKTLWIGKKLFTYAEVK